MLLWESMIVRFIQSLNSKYTVTTLIDRFTSVCDFALKKESTYKI